MKIWLPMCGTLEYYRYPWEDHTFYCDRSKTIRPPFSRQIIITSPWDTLLWKIKLLICILYGCVLKSFAKDSLPLCRWPAYSLSTSIEWNAAVCATWTSGTWGREIHWDPGGGWSKDDELSRRGRRQTIRTVCLQHSKWFNQLNRWAYHRNSSGLSTWKEVTVSTGWFKIGGQFEQKVCNF